VPRILIVDDSEDLVEVYRDTLALKGFDVETAFDGEEGLRRVSEFHPDVVLLDMMMPDVDGLEFLARLAASSPTPVPRVIANSGFDSYRAEALRRGAHAFLSKPVSLGVLLAAIAAAVPGEQVPTEKLIENQQQVADAREKSRHAAGALIDLLTEDRMSTVGECLQALVEWLRRYYGFGEVFLHFINGDDVYLQASAGTDLHYLAPGMHYPKTSVYCGDVIDVGSTLYVSDPLRHPAVGFSHHNEVRKRGWHFYIGAPLATKSGAVLGTLCLMDRTPHDMHQEDVRLFEALATRVAAMLGDIAAGGPVDRALIDSERVFDEDALALLLGIAVRRTARNRGRLQLARISLRDRADYALVTRKAYGVTSGLRFAMTRAPQGDELVSLYDGADASIVHNNMRALEAMIGPTLTGFDTLEWSGSEAARELHGDEPLPTHAAHAISAVLLERLGVTDRSRFAHGLNGYTEIR
jgi:CheY-like chemotaxis protein